MISLLSGFSSTDFLMVHFLIHHSNFQPPVNRHWLKKLGEELYTAKGDATLYVQIMLSYYKASKKILDKKLTPPTRTNSTTEDEDIDVEIIVRKNIKDELNDIELFKYATRVTNDYEDAMTSKLSNFSDVWSFLLSDTLIGKYYNNLMTQFPTCRYVFATIVLSRSYSIVVDTPLNAECIETSKEEVHRKHRMILHIFLGLIWTKN